MNQDPYFAKDGGSSSVTVHVGSRRLVMSAATGASAKPVNAGSVTMPEAASSSTPRR
jgi:hypothetical protein